MDTDSLLCICNTYQCKQRHAALAKQVLQMQNKTNKQKKEIINAIHHYIDHVWPLEVGDSIINMEVLFFFVMSLITLSQHVSVSSQVFRGLPLRWPDWRGWWGWWGWWDLRGWQGWSDCSGWQDWWRWGWLQQPDWQRWWGWRQ